MRRFFPLGIIFAIVGIFFYKTVLFGHLPFPGDLLIAEYRPWRNYSFLGYNPGAYPHKAQYFDVLRQLYPWRTLSMDLIKQGQLPVWNPYNFSGTPLLANFQSAALYPLNILFFFFSDAVAWSILVILQPLLALVFLYRYCRKIALLPAASLLSAISYAFGSFMTVWLEYNTIGHVLAWLPLSLLSIEHLREHQPVKWIVVFISSLVLSLLAGHPQVAIYALIFVTAYGCFRLPSLKPKVTLLLFVFLSIGIAAVQLIPGIELIYYSARTPLNFQEILNKVLIQPWQLVMLFVQDLFGNPATRTYWPADTYVGKVTSIGIVPLLFVSSLLFQKIHRLGKFFLTSAGVVLLLTTRNPLTELIYRLNLPLISSGSPTLLTFVFQFALAVCAGFGLDAWRRNGAKSERAMTTLLPTGAIIALLWIVVFAIPKLSVARNPLIVATGVFGASLLLLLLWSKKPKYAPLVVGVLLLVHLLQLWQAFQKFNPFVPKELVFPSVPILETIKERAGVNRFWSFGAATIEANFATHYRIFSPEGYDPLYPRWYGEFIHAADDGKLLERFNRDTRSDARIAATDGRDLAVNPFRKRILDLVGTRYLLDQLENNNSEKTIPPTQFPAATGENGWILYENKNALSRIFLASDARVFKSKEEFSRTFFDPTFSPSNTILLTSPLVEPLGNALSKTVTVVSYSPHTMEFKTSAAAATLLFLSDTYYPGWKAWVDEKETSILPANYSFRAVYVPEGSHTVRFVYDPLTVKIGVAISFFSLVASAIFLRRLP